MKYLPLLLLSAFACSRPGTTTNDLFSGRCKVADLTHTISTTSPSWPSDGDVPYEYDTLFAQPSGKPGMGRYRVAEHFGTHLDAPIHSADGQPSVDALPAADLVGHAVVIDVSATCATQPDYLLTKEDILQWEKQYGPMPARAIVIMYTGWCRKWNDVASYRNTDAAGQMHFPGFSPEAATFLTTERDILGIGIDNLSVDAAISKGFPVHKTVNGSGKFQLENLANVDQLPASGAGLIVAPVKLEGGSGGQVRVYAVY